MHPLGLATLAFTDTDTLTFIDAAVAGGFDAVTLRLVPSSAGDFFMPLLDDPLLEREVRARLDGGGLTVFDIEACSLRVDTDVRAFRPALELAAQLGARRLLAMAWDPDRGRLLANLAALCELAAATGMAIALEFIPYSEVKTIAAARQVVHDVGKANLGVVVDALHLARSGGTPADVRAVDADPIAYLQICDANADVPRTVEALRSESRTGRRLPGEGSLWLAELIDALPAGLTITVEAPCAEDAGRPPAERAKRAAGATRKLLAARAS